jgi:hypothetical protein
VRSARRPAALAKIVVFLALVLVVRACSQDRDTPPSEPVASRIERELIPTAELAGTTRREGIAAVVLMDVSGSMDENVRGEDSPKIVVARRAAFDLVTQFHTYAAAHPDEPVLVGLFEFSGSRRPWTREVIPLGPPDLVAAKTALARMRADGGTPIGDAMIAGKRALDSSGLSRRHLLVVTDGENTDGPGPADVMAALGGRPEAERPSVYFVAFDIAGSRFDGVRHGGGLVLEAADEAGLNKTLDFLLTGRILVEQ